MNGVMIAPMMLTARNAYSADWPFGSAGRSSAAGGAAPIFTEAMTKATVTSPAKDTDFSITPNVRNQSRAHTRSVAGSAHNRNEMPVASYAPMAMPPISDD